MSGPWQKVVDLCQKANISSLYDARGAQEIMNSDYFTEGNIEIIFQKYDHPSYNQLFGDFLPYMSIIDLLLNEGPKSLQIVKKGRNL